MVKTPKLLKNKSQVKLLVLLVDLRNKSIPGFTEIEPAGRVFVNNFPIFTSYTSRFIKQVILTIFSKVHQDIKNQKQRAGVINLLVGRHLISLLIFLISAYLTCTGKGSEGISGGIKSADTSLIKLYVSTSRKWQNERKFDSAMAYLDKARSLAEKSGLPGGQFDVLKEFGNLMALNGSFSPALEYYFKALKILDEEARTVKSELELETKYSEVYLLIGTGYFKMESFDKALHYYTKSLLACRDIYAQDHSFPIDARSLALYNNIGSVYLTQDKLDSAKINFTRALEINRKINNDAYAASLYNNMGIISKNRKNYDEAFEYYHKALEIRSGLKDTAGMAQVYNNLGDCYNLTGNYAEAIKVLNRALEFSRLSNSLTSQMKAANFLTIAYEKAGDYRKSLNSQRLYNALFDSLNNDEQVRLAARLELQYSFEKKQRENELLQQIELAKKQRKVLVLMIISGVLLFSFVIFFLLNRNKKIKLKRNALIQEGLLLESKNLNLEKQNLLLEKQNLELELDFRNKELATHVMYLVKKNEFIASISAKMIDLKSKLSFSNSAGIQDIVREMKSNIDHTVWNEFEVRFQNVHQSFYNNLQARYPDLSPNERKLCAFIRLNMTIKDISAITYQSENSIRVARIRLRKKIGLDRDENLVAFLQQL